MAVARSIPSDLPKVDRSLAARVAAHPETEVEVMIVLDLPQPDVSFLFGGKKRRGKPATDGDWSAALGRVDAVLQTHGRHRIRAFRNAGSVLANVDAGTLAELAEADCVKEIVPNARLR